MEPAKQDNTNHLVFRNPERRDGKSFWEIARASGTLDVNSVYHYLIMCRHFAKTSLTAERLGEVVGFVTAYIPPGQPDTLFVWQVAVDEKERGRGLGVRMLTELFQRTRALGARFLEATITPSNQASIKLFTAAARELKAPFVFEREFFSAADFGSHVHEPETLFHIGPIAD